MAKKEVERKEVWVRIVVAIVSGIVLEVWGVLICVLAIINWFVTLFSGKRDGGLADFCEYWNSETYRYFRYLTSATNERPFPFSEMVRIGKFER